MVGACKRGGRPADRCLHVAVARRWPVMAVRDHLVSAVIPPSSRRVHNVTNTCATVRPLLLPTSPDDHRSIAPRPSRRHHRTRRRLLLAPPATSLPNWGFDSAVLAVVLHGRPETYRRYDRL